METILAFLMAFFPILNCSSVYLPDISFSKYLVFKSLQNPFSHINPSLTVPILSTHYCLQLSFSHSTH